MRRLLEFLARPVTIGVAVGMVFSIFFVSIQGPARCNDGWHSPSIGRQGACSHHGGVESSLLPFELILSALLGWAAATLRSRPIERRRLAEQQAERERVDAETKARALADGIACPNCGFPMRMQGIYRGSKRGSYFMSCTRYPACKGARDLTENEATRVPKRKRGKTSDPLTNDPWS